MATCEWPIESSNCAVFDELSKADRTMYEEMAVEYLRTWVYGKYGICEKVVRPCKPDRSTWSTFYGRGPSRYPFTWMGPWQPALLDGRWYNLSCGTCSGECGCERGPQTLKLPGPVHSVEEVRLDGEVFLGWRYEEPDLVVRTDGGTWPLQQDLDMEPSEPGTFMVMFKQGLEVPKGGQIAAGILACEFAKAALRKADCALPARIQTITRQGISVTLMDNFEGLDEGRTGIWLIDSWVASARMERRRATVMSPDYRSRP